MLPTDTQQRLDNLHAELREALFALALDATRAAGAQDLPEPVMASLQRAMDRVLAAVSAAVMERPEARTDPFGPARAGSQLQIQLYVNRFAEELNTAVLE